MSLRDLAYLPAHLLAASIHRNGKRHPVRLVDIGPERIVVDSAALAPGERARVTIACPLSETPCEIVAESVRTRGARTWLAVV